MKLYYSKGACSLVPHIIINELDLVCEYESVDLASKKTSTGVNFYTVNPKGAVPALMTDQGELLTENAVILQYLADTFKNQSLLPVVGDFARYRVLEWLNFVATDLHKGFGPLFNSQIPAELKDKIFIPNLKAKLSYVNDHLAHAEFLCGADFTLPDAYLFVMLKWAEHFKLDMSSLPNLAAYYAALKKRKSVQQSYKEEGIM